MFHKKIFRKVRCFTNKPRHSKAKYTSHYPGFSPTDESSTYQRNRSIQPFLHSTRTILYLVFGSLFNSPVRKLRTNILWHNQLLGRVSANRDRYQASLPLIFTISSSFRSIQSASGFRLSSLISVALIHLRIAAFAAFVSNYAVSFRKSQIFQAFCSFCGVRFDVCAVYIMEVWLFRIK